MGWVVSAAMIQSGALLWLPPLLLAAWVVAKALNALWWRPRQLERMLRAQGLAGTPYRFLFGDLKEMGRLMEEAESKPMPPLSHDIGPRVAAFLTRKTKELGGGTSFTWLGPVPRVTLMEPELVKEVLVKKFDQIGRPDLGPYGHLLTTGVFSYHGEKWAKHRKILNPAFHLEKLKGMLPAMLACCSEMIEKWESKLGPEGSSEIDIWPDFQGLSADVISHTAFGSSYKEGKRIFLLQSEQAELLLLSLQSIYIPGFRFLPTPKNNRRKAIYREVQSILRGIIKKREEAIKMGEPPKQDLLGLLLESTLNHSRESGDKKGGMTTDEMIEECKLFFFAGQETTSILLTMALITLSMHPDWQERAREEVMQAFGKNKPEFEELGRLKIVTMILYEVLRLYPSVPILERTTNKPVQIGNLSIPAGVGLSLPAVFFHNDRKYWGKDAGEFNPERFAEGVSKASKDQFAFFPFGGGPRVCIGQNYSLLEAKMALGMILQRFSFELSPSYSHAPTAVFTLQPQHGAPLKFRRL
ncbi:cytochrome P450 CYP72A616-like [Curcuma longa]|uniref:cytochrome P450 CYP72A616-like n=1 Tax=Curcuma longa TaxID=136217 RepID=UPI003D9F8AC7